MDIASPNTEEVTTARWFVMRAYKSEKRAEEKLKGKDGLEYFIPKCYAVRVYHGVKSKPYFSHSESRIRTCQPHADH